MMATRFWIQAGSALLAAASSAAMSIFFIVIITSKARLALALSDPVVSSSSSFGVICHE